jgi:hypothetical protein
LRRGTVKSRKPGKSTSEAEVLGVSRNGVWLFVVGKEYFLPFKDYPWFREARISEIYSVLLLRSRHLHWPDLDVDLHIDSLQEPDHYPLVYR